MARPDEERPGSDSHWVKSSLSFSNGNCVEVANLSEGGVAVRNSRDPEGPVLRFTPDEWHAFLGGAQLGEFDSFGRLRFQSREQRRVLPDGPGGPSAAASPQIASSPAEPFAGWRKSPAHGAGSRHRCGRRAAACAGACREYGEPPGALRFTVPTSAPRRIAAGCPLRHRGEPGRDPRGHVKCPAQPGVRRLAWGSGPVPGPGAYPHRRGSRRIAADCACLASQEPVFPATGYVLALVTGSLERKRHRCKSIGRRVAIPFMRFLQLAGRGLRIALRVPAGKSEHRADPHQVLVAAQILLQVAVQDIGQLTDLRL